MFKPSFSSSLCVFFKSHYYCKGDYITISKEKSPDMYDYADHKLYELS